MTIKTQGGKVITKDGKVSCECCEGPEFNCCLYSAQALFDGLYTVDDLPNSILLVGNPAAKTDPVPELFGTVGWMTGLNLGDSALVYSSFDPSWILFERFEGDDGLYWDSASNFFAEKCLFAFDDEGPATGLVEDEFADTYTVAWNISNQSGSSTATRQSLCIWTFTALGGGHLIQYESVDFFRWRIVTPETEIFKAEPSFENTPTGYYETGGADFTVS
jgi:hypothetical protein